MAESGGLSWEAKEVFQKIKSFNRLPGAGIPLIQLNMRVGSAKTVKKGIPELKSVGLITDTASGEPTLTDKGSKTGNCADQRNGGMGCAEYRNPSSQPRLGFIGRARGRQCARSMEANLLPNDRCPHYKSVMETDKGSQAPTTNNAASEMSCRGELRHFTMYAR